MALSILKVLLQDYVQSLIEERIVNERFFQILTKFEEPDCVQLINIYLNDVESILSELSSTIDSSDLNFSKLSMLADKIEKKSTRYIGVQHMKLAAIRLVEACDKEDQKIWNRGF
ncbi:histidine-containing phosphotransfer protein 2-like [Cucumis melo var. makuwa]|uniref:Histidine-containing phosphotransfer protein n=1 Tax=Cucumis melo var. makuwa TaxID=1194695 RepID=A0A5A7STT0_CUCMM|nr:histidine-containing phosphotransfer protein 2-like [Cucumis melo var. makuwa]